LWCGDTVEVGDVGGVGGSYVGDDVGGDVVVVGVGYVVCVAVDVAGVVGCVGVVVVVL